MATYNKWIGIGNLTRDIDMRFLPNGDAAAKIGLAVNKRFTTKGGDTKEETLFIDVTFFGKQAEVVNQYVKKGDPIMVEGSLRLEEWDDKKSGERRRAITVRADGFQILRFHNDGDRRPGGAAAQQSQNSGVAPRPASASPDDDVPF
jgi:single-strand DNA-binding protein